MRVYFFYMDYIYPYIPFKWLRNTIKSKLNPSLPKYALFISRLCRERLDGVPFSYTIRVDKDNKTYIDAYADTKKSLKNKFKIIK